MTDDKDAKAAATDEKDGKPFTVGDLRELIGAEVKKLVGTGKEAAGTDTEAHKEAQKVTETGLDAKSNIASEVQAAIKHIQDREAATNRDKDIDTKLADLMKRTEEQPPVERRKVHRIMGWGE